MDGPIVVVEGVDGSGGTTFARRLAADFGMKYVHVGAPQRGRDVFEHHFAPVRWETGPTVVDRLHWSDDVYGAVLRGGPGMSDAEFSFIDGFLAARRGLIVVCCPPLETVIENIELRPGHENHDPGVATKVYAGYRVLLPRTLLPTVVYDYTRGEPEYRRVTTLVRSKTNG